MPGAEDQSLVRRISHLSFADRASWKNAADVPEQARSEFVRPDGKTSFWDEGHDRRNRAAVVMALLLQRQSIGSLPLGTLWRNDLPENVVSRIDKTPGKTPHTPAIDLHFELQSPEELDYAEFALAVAKRDELSTVSAADARDMLEDAYFNGLLVSGLHADLRGEIEKLIQRRSITVEELSHNPALPRVRFGEAQEVIPKSLILNEDDFVERLRKSGIGKGTEFVLYCANGCASRLSARRLRGEGFTAVRFLVGGFEAWRDAGQPISKTVA